MRRLYCCGISALAALLCVPVFSFAQAISPCQVSTAAPTFLPGQRVPCSVAPDGGQRTHWLDQFGGEHVDAQVEDNGYIRTVGGLVRTKAIMTDVLTNTASATVAIPTGPKTITANVDGTGAVTATVNVYGDITSTAEAINLLCTITLTATTRDVDACPPFTANYPFYHAVTTNVTGTGAAVDVTANY